MGGGNVVVEEENEDTLNMERPWRRPRNFPMAMVVVVVVVGSNVLHRFHNKKGRGEE